MWRVAAAQATGSSHLNAGTACQDRFGCTVLPDGTLVAALADGAGSAALGGEGAEVAVRTALAQFDPMERDPAADPAGALHAAALCARAAILDLAERQAEDPRAYASTLLLVLATAEGGAALQIGDGVIVVRQEDATYRWVFWPQHGEYANTTWFLTDDQAVDHIQTEVLPTGAVDVALLSDGLEPLALQYASRRVYEPFFSGMFQPLVAATPNGLEAVSASLEAFLASDRIRSRTDDDVSLILATRRSAVPPD